jgi:hypothetical protein
MCQRRLSTLGDIALVVADVGPTQAAPHSLRSALTMWRVRESRKANRNGSALADGCGEYDAPVSTCPDNRRDRPDRPTGSTPQSADRGWLATGVGEAGLASPRDIFSQADPSDGWRTAWLVDQMADPLRSPCPTIPSTSLPGRRAGTVWAAMSEIRSMGIWPERRASRLWRLHHLGMDLRLVEVPLGFAGRLGAGEP